MKNLYFILLIVLYSCSPDKEKTESYNKSGKQKYEYKDYNGAIVEFNKAIQNDPNSAIAYYERGKAKQKLKDYKSAISDFINRFRDSSVEWQKCFIRRIAR